MRDLFYTIDNMNGRYKLVEIVNMCPTHSERITNVSQGQISNCHIRSYIQM